MMPDRLLLQEDSGDGTSISVPAGRHISTAFLMLTRRKSDTSTILQNTDQDEQETLVSCRWSHLGHSGSHPYCQRNQRIQNTAIREHLVAAADHVCRADSFLSDVPQNSEQILRQDFIT